MPRLSQAKRATAKTSGGSSSGKNGEAHWLLQLWLTHRLYPACAIRGRNPDDFSLVPHKDDDKKLWCKLCKVGIQAKNEKNKHRHEQSDAHLDACAAALKLPKENLDRPYYWHCVDCNMKLARSDCHSRHVANVANDCERHPNALVICVDMDAPVLVEVVDDFYAVEVEDVSDFDSPAVTSPLVPSMPLGRDVSSPIPFTRSLAPTPPLTWDYSTASSSSPLTMPAIDAAPLSGASLGLSDFDLVDFISKLAEPELEPEPMFSLESQQSIFWRPENPALGPGISYNTSYSDNLFAVDEDIYGGPDLFSQSGLRPPDVFNAGTGFNRLQHDDELMYDDWNNLIDWNGSSAV